MNLRSPLHRSRNAASLLGAAGSSSGRAFTLIEMMIAVGAVGIIAIGIAKMFASTGEVVKLGRRSSALNEMAATLESQIRRDITGLAGQGEAFMVIRNKLITDGAGNGIPLSADDRNPTPRARRVDEFVCFTHGSYTSAREPQYPGRAPQGSAARIYYGHGMKRDSYTDLRLDADPIWSAAPVNQWPAGLGRPGPNHYPASWTLLRQATVLARPQDTQYKFPALPNMPTFLNTTNWNDSAVQIGLQPAAASIFRFDPLRVNNPDILGNGYMSCQSYTLATGPVYAIKPPPTINQNQIARPNDNNITTNPFPSFASGLVDVAAMDLSQVRARIIGLGPNYKGATTTPDNPPMQLLRDETFFKFQQVPQAVAPRMPLTLGTPPSAVDFISTDYFKNIAHDQKMMMASALPGNDPWLFRQGSFAQPTANVGGFTDNNSPAEQRMIYAPTPPDFTGNLNNGGHAWDSNEPYHQQDQAMLGASNLVAGCTEFIVEWSFGDVFPTSAGGVNLAANDPRIGQMIWHGLYRDVPGSQPVQPYRAGASYNAGTLPDGLYTNPPAGLMHWPADIPATGNAPWTTGGTWANLSEQPLYSFFGYHDPSYNGAGSRSWPWPKLLRFTIGLTDPADPTFEQVVQFVVEIPSRQHLQ